MEQVWVKDGSEVWRAVGGRAGEGRYLKIATGDGEDVAGEAGRLRWLASAGLGTPTTPAVVAAGSLGVGGFWLVTEALPGTPAHDVGLRSDGGRRLAETVGRGLRAWHDSLPVERCPYQANLDTLLVEAERRVAAGGVEADQLEPQYRQLSPAQALSLARAQRPPEPAEDLVVAHGDPCLPNLLVDPATATVTGMVDLGRLGVSDRYRDLAIAVRSYVQNTGPQEVWRLLEAYGIDRPDPVRLDYYVLLDELW